MGNVTGLFNGCPQSSALRLLGDRDLTTVLGVFQPENRDASCCAVTIMLAVGICLKTGLLLLIHDILTHNLGMRPIYIKRNLKTYDRYGQWNMRYSDLLYLVQQ
jgi:hypothetical protein